MTKPMTIPPAALAEVKAQVEKIRLWRKEYGAFGTLSGQSLNEMDEVADSLASLVLREGEKEKKPEGTSRAAIYAHIEAQHKADIEACGPLLANHRLYRCFAEEREDSLALEAQLAEQIAVGDASARSAEREKP